MMMYFEWGWTLRPLVLTTGHLKKAKGKSKKYIRTLRPLRRQSESAKRPLVPLKVKVKKVKD